MSFTEIFNGSGYLCERFYRNIPVGNHPIPAKREEVLSMIDKFKAEVAEQRGELGAGHELEDKELRTGLQLCQRYINGKLDLSADEARIVFDGTWLHFDALKEMAEKMDAGEW